MRVLFIILTIAIFLSFSFKNGVETDKYALLVAVSEYPENSGWSRINGENDIFLIKNALLLRGFKEDHIQVLKGEQATKANILNAFQNISTHLQKGDFFIFHFSGHGQQVEDVAPMIDEVDGFDEALIPYDAPYENKDGSYQGQRHLLDDEMESALFSIRKKIGTDGQVLLLIDACHSGSMTRTDEQQQSGPFRGTGAKLMINNSGNDQIKNQVESDNTGFFETQREQTELGNLISIAASRPSELNRECFKNNKFYGPLSYAFAKVFPKIKEGTNYQLFFDLLKNEILSITDYQVPTIDGPLNVVLGENQLKPIHEYHSVIRVFDVAYLEVDAGQLLNFHEGTEFYFYPNGRDTAGQKIAKGIVTEANLFTSVVKYELLKDASNENLERAYISRQDFGDIQLTVSLDLQNGGLRETLQSDLTKIDAINIINQNADLLIQENGKSTEVIADGQVIKDFETYKYNDEQLSELIIETAILRYGQSRFLANLEMKNEDFKIQAKIIPVNLELNEEGEIIQKKIIPLGDLAFSQQGLLKMPLGSFYQIEVNNTGKKSAYLSILDIQPDGQFNIAIPFPQLIDNHKYKAEDYFFQPGDKRILEGHFWGMGRPVGIEQYLVIATDQPLDLEKINQTRGTTTSNSPFEELFNNSFNAFNQSNKTRSGKVPPIIPSSINIEKIFLEITE